MRSDPQLLVVGAGPAGLAAAAEATRAGVRTMLVDAANVAGGQYYARPPGGDWRAGLPADVLAGARLELLDVRLETAAWGVFGDAVALVHGERSELVRPAAIVVATGAVERAVPFPGWDRPGVVAPGALQRLLKVARVVPSGRVAVAGSGPFLLAVAADLRAAGADVVAVLESRRRRELAPLLPFVAGDRARRTEAVRFARRLRGVPLRFGVVVRGAGDGGLTLGDGTRVAADVACVGHGFAPRTELARLLGCALDADAVHVDAGMATTRPGVFAAGETTGVGGAQLATAEGRLAGVAASRYLGYAVAGTRERALAAARAAQARFARRLASAYPRPPVLGQAAPETVICRCEGVTLKELRGRRDGPAPVDDSRAAKAELRCGMGACQGLFCAEAVGAAVGAGVAAGSRRLPRARPPLGAVTVRTVAESDAT